MFYGFDQKAISIFRTSLIFQKFFDIPGEYKTTVVRRLKSYMFRTSELYVLYLQGNDINRKCLASSVSVGLTLVSITLDVRYASRDGVRWVNGTI